VEGLVFLKVQIVAGIDRVPVILSCKLLPRRWARRARLGHARRVYSTNRRSSRAVPGTSHE
jgi:hypothetical protein